MLFSSLFERLTRGSKPNPDGRPRRRLCRKASFQPTLEFLEDRSLPSAGFLNPQFGTGGKTLVNFGANPIAGGTFGTSWPVAAVQGDGTTLLAGLVTNAKTGQVDFAVAELTKNGNLNPSFGSGGKAIIDVPGFYAYQIWNIAIQHGKIMLLGSVWSNDNLVNDVVVAEMNEDGGLNQGFGNGGVSLIHAGNVNPNGFFVGSANLVFHSDGTILLGWGSVVYQPYSVLVYRYFDLRLPAGSIS